MPDCLFCKIINKEIPAEIVYEDDKFLAFLDLHPVNFGHTLVLPKQHFGTFDELPNELCGPMAKIMQKIMKSLIDVLGYDGVNLMQNNRPAAGQVIPHVHFHVVPRKLGDGFKHWHGKDYEPGEMAAMGEKIKLALLNYDK
ncbi:MAG: HIT family protein [Patescibacteria group bacterium]|jgi:histidine triad (HIT) family protein